MRQLKEHQLKELGNLIDNELNNQFSKFGLQNHSLQTWMTILVEEIGEIAKGILDFDNNNIKTEIIHSITVLIQILEKIERF